MSCCWTYARTLFRLALLLLACTAIAHPPLRESADIPGGVLEFQVIQLTAPDSAIDAYIDTFSERRWTIEMDSRGAFIGHALGLELSSSSREALFNSQYWQPAPDGNGFVVRPTASALSALDRDERRELYHELARWSDNKPELWPLIFPDETSWDRLAAAGIPAPFIQRARSLCYPFHGGEALSDFSVLAHEFPDREVLRRFLETQSTVTTVLPRLKLRNAKTISETLAYWTVNHHNPFARPMLEALLESETTDGVELISIMPSSARLLSFDIETADVSHDLQLASYVISSNLATPSPMLNNHAAFSDWFASNFEPTPPPFRYGDVLALDHPVDLVLNYACAYIGSDLVFARDPVGLGLWRFMRLPEVLKRNPHFSGGSFAGLRYQGGHPSHHDGHH